MAEPASIEAPADAELSCRALRTLLIYFRRSFNPQALDAAVQRAALGPGIDTAYLSDENNWISLAQGQRLLDVLTQCSNDEDFPRKAGRIVMSREVLGTAHSVLRAFGSPRFTYRKVLELSNFYNRAGHFTLLHVSSRKIAVTYQSQERESNRRFCELRLGQLESFPTLWNLPLAHSRELSCQARGDSCCSYEFEWVRGNRYLLVLLGALLGTAGAMAGVHFLGWEAPLALSCGTLLGTLLGGISELREQLTERNRLIVDQIDDSLRDHASLRMRFEEVQQLNFTLEAKVENRTQELKATSIKLEQALARQVELDQLKTQFFTNLNHDLRSPLTVVTGALSSLLVSPLKAAPSQQQFVEMALRSATRLEAMIGDMLELARIDAGVPRLDLARVDLVEVLDEILEVTQSYASARGLNLQSNLPSEPVLIDADVSKLERVVMNLLFNACKFSPTGTTITLKLEALPNLVRIHVMDQGVGIAQEDCERIFDRFVRVTDEKQRPVKGTGIGLAVVKEFVDLHGGKVEVKSILGKGSDFIVQLPKNSSQPSRGTRRRPERMGPPLSLLLPEAAAPSPEVQRERNQLPGVLLIEDNDEVRGYLRAELSGSFPILEMANAEDALQTVNDRLPRIVLSDLALPGMSGLELCRRLRMDTRTAQLPFLLFSAKGDVQTKLEAFAAGADDFMAKPFHPQELRARIESLLRRSETGH